MTHRDAEGPDFVCIGAQKAGTTWLYRTLSRHDDVWLPPVKEIHYFDLVCANEQLLGVEAGKWPSGIDRLKPLVRRPSLRSLRWLYRFYRGFPSTDWYYELFADELTGGKATGDITPAYSTLDERGVAYARKILKPQCSVILVVRNPIERFWSSRKMYLRWKDAPLEAEDVRKLTDVARRPTHWLRGDYVGIVNRWRDYFGDRFRVFLYDRLREKPKTFIRDILSFMGLSPNDLDAPLPGRANADPERQEIPPELHEQLAEIYEPEIKELDQLVPGVAEKWL